MGATASLIVTNKNTETSSLINDLFLSLLSTTREERRRRHKVQYRRAKLKVEDVKVAKFVLIQVNDKYFLVSGPK